MTQSNHDTASLRIWLWLTYDQDRVGGHQGGKRFLSDPLCLVIVVLNKHEYIRLIHYIDFLTILIASLNSNQLSSPVVSFILLELFILWNLQNKIMLLLPDKSLVTGRFYDMLYVCTCSDGRWRVNCIVTTLQTCQ